MGWQCGVFVDDPLCVCLRWTLSGGHLRTDLLVLLVDVHQLYDQGPGQIPHKRVAFFFENVYEKPLCSPTGIQNIHRKFFVLLLCQLPVLRCLAFMDFLG